MSDLGPSARRVLTIRDGVTTDRANRARFEASDLAELGFRLGMDRAMCKQLGHDWDVADVIAVVRLWQDEVVDAA